MTALAVAALTSAGCGGSDNAPRPDGATAEVTGRVRLAGSTPFEKVMIEPEGDAVEVKGELAEELTNLQGALVRAEGRLDSDRLFFVSDYEVLEIVGSVPLVGTLARRDDLYLLETEDGETVVLDRAPEAFTELRGAKIWVLTDESGAVWGYGVIRKR